MDRVVILQQIVPKYRVHFFNELKAHLDFELYASNKGLEKSLSTFTEDINYKQNIVKSLIFENRAIFQFLPFRKLISKDIVIFEFNIRIISNIFLLLIRIAINKKNILWSHGITESMSHFSKFVRVFFIKRANSVIVYEKTGKNILIKLGVPRQNIFVAKNSIDIRQMIKLSDRKQKKFRITFIGRIIKEKNLLLLCSSFLNIINKINLSIVLTIIGDGEELDTLKKKFANSDRIDFIGHLNDEKKIASYLNQTLFTVSPDYLGLSIIHSFSYSVPILVNKHPKLKHSPEIELFHDDRNGWYFDGTQNSLENKIIKCLNNIELLKEFGNNGLKKVKTEYGVEVMIKYFLQSIRNCYPMKNKNNLN